jgi:hypothetical protein
MPNDRIQKLIEQGNVTRGRRTTDQAEQLLDDFAAELGFEDKSALGETLDRCRTYVVDVILPISWYTAKINRARHIRTAYIIGTGLLILLIPVGLAYIPQLTGTGVTSSVVAQLGGALTGVLALQKMVSASLAAQQRYGVWWKVSSDLKKLWYGLQTKWLQNGLAANWAQKEAEFCSDLDGGIQRARGLVSDEEADFFQKLTIPSVDVLDLLSKTRPDVSSMIGALLPGAASANAVAAALTGQATDLVRDRQDLAKNTKFLASLNIEIDKKRKELAAASAEDKPAIRLALDELLKRHNAAAIAKMEAEAAVAAATAH